MRIALGSDHTGVSHRKRVRARLHALGVECKEFGPETDESVDYPDIAYQVARAVADHECDYGVIVCGTGIGVSIAANKVPGILAAACHNEYTTEMSRRHNHANVLCLGAREENEEEVASLVELWLKTAPEGRRHTRRVERIRQIEHEILSKQKPVEPVSP